MSFRYERNAGWARAKQCLWQALRGQGHTNPEIGWIRHLGQGLSRDAYTAESDLEDYVILLQSQGAPPGYRERAEREAWILQRLEPFDLDLRVPQLVALVEENHGVALVETAVPGIPLDLRAGRQPSIRPWEVVASVAATVHSLGPQPFPGWAGYSTRREHAEHAIKVFHELEKEQDPASSVIREARAWATAHLPPPEVPSTLLHGDLLGQNIVLAIDLFSTDEEPPGLIDWESCLNGDPAYDLAIITRGVRRPFQMADGMRRLLDAYGEFRGVEVLEEEVRLHELCLAASWYRDSLDPMKNYPQSPENAFQFLQAVLRRATGR